MQNIMISTSSFDMNVYNIFILIDIFKWQLREDVLSCCTFDPQGVNHHNQPIQLWYEYVDYYYSNCYFLHDSWEMMIYPAALSILSM